MTVVIITHNLAICPMGDRVIRIMSGRVIDNTVNPHPQNIETIEW
jgi:putative ABC transport system ATP-binding protein